LQNRRTVIRILYVYCSSDSKLWLHCQKLLAWNITF